MNHSQTWQPQSELKRAVGITINSTGGPQTLNGDDATVLTYIRLLLAACNKRKSCLLRGVKFELELTNGRRRINGRSCSSSSFLLTTGTEKCKLATAA